MDDKYDVHQDIADTRKKILLEDIATAEALAKPYLAESKGKLLMGTDYNSFGGLNNPTGASMIGVDDMSLQERLVWVASRLWAVCQKIKLDDELNAEAGRALDKYMKWLIAMESHRNKSISGGITKPMYSEDLNTLIKQIIIEVNNKDAAIIKNEVFKKLVGQKLGVIENIIHEDGILSVFWSSNDASKPERIQPLKKSAIDKRVKLIISRM